MLIPKENKWNESKKRSKSSEVLTKTDFKIVIKKYSSKILKPGIQGQRRNSENREQADLLTSPAQPRRSAFAKSSKMLDESVSYDFQSKDNNDQEEEISHKKQEKSVSIDKY